MYQTLIGCTTLLKEEVEVLTKIEYKRLSVKLYDDSEEENRCFHRSTYYMINTNIFFF